MKEVYTKNVLNNYCITVQSVVERMLREVTGKLSHLFNGSAQRCLSNIDPTTSELSTNGSVGENKVDLFSNGNIMSAERNEAHSNGFANKSKLVGKPYRSLFDYDSNLSLIAVGFSNQNLDKNGGSSINNGLVDDKSSDVKLLAVKKQESNESIGRYVETDHSTMTAIVDCNLAPHRWLDDRRLLYLSDPLAENIRVFQKQWRKSLPIVVTDCNGTTAIPDLWTPDSFRREFAGLKADLVDCATGAVLHGQSTEKFWFGFESAGTTKHKNGGVSTGGNCGAVLRLKDWPAVEDPIGARWHRDLARTLPIREYTLQTGVYNLVSHLPDFFVKPELSVRIHAGYGSALHPASVAFTKLRVDPADCVNVLMYTEIPAIETDIHKNGE